MLGIRYVKSQPTTFLMAYRNGKVSKAGMGLSLYYYGPSTTLVAVPMANKVNDFIFSFTTADFQAVTVQGQITWRISQPQDAARALNLALKPDGKSYETDDIQKLAQFVLRPVEVQAQKSVQAMSLKTALISADKVMTAVRQGIATDKEVHALGVELLGVSIAAIKPTPETARALEAEARESILKAADDAIFMRRNSAVENERAIRESELDTEVAVELKKRQIKETQMDAQASLRRKDAELKASDMESSIKLEERRQAFVETNARNTRTLAEAEAHKLGAVMTALEKTDPKVVQALAAAGMNPGQLIAQAFGGIAERAEKIGQLNMSPDLLDSLLRAVPAAGRPNTDPKGARESRAGSN